MIPEANLRGGRGGGAQAGQRQMHLNCPSAGAPSTLGLEAESVRLGTWTHSWQVLPRNLRAAYYGYNEWDSFTYFSPWLGVGTYSPRIKAQAKQCWLILL